MSSSSLDAEHELEQEQLLDRFMVEMNSDYSSSVMLASNSSIGESVEGSVNDDGNSDSDESVEPRRSESEQLDAAMDNIGFDEDDGTSALYESEVDQGTDHLFTRDCLGS